MKTLKRSIGNYPEPNVRCGRRVSYPSRAVVERAAADARRRLGDPRLRVRRCSDCKGFHVRPVLV